MFNKKPPRQAGNKANPAGIQTFPPGVSSGRDLDRWDIGHTARIAGIARLLESEPTGKLPFFCPRPPMFSFPSSSRFTRLPKASFFSVRAPPVSFCCKSTKTSGIFPKHMSTKNSLFHHTFRMIKSHALYNPQNETS